ncbi:glycosyltransferase family 2 protein [Deefgea piscis]|uniref:Glycosyltransferase family 2 protein n=1 Tax=Deefgea piscis TaxID=2739061 RepID=A0A6M8SRV0_9NEIS|nr:glycosyltransferase family 2 protein [Deefgea piscis]QKJ66854.1 glycosyltransferase family 2 protein [Deefgea piscis]
MLISIVVPLFNKSDYILATLKSILNQTYSNFEVLIVDDGSKDDGATKVKQIQDARIQLIQVPNGGVARARNIGIEKASGDLVCFLDADDLFHPLFLQTIVRMAEQFPDYGWYSTSYRRLADQQMNVEQLNTSGIDASVEVTDFYNQKINYGAFFCTNTVAIWRCHLNAMQPCFPVGESMAEDLDLWFRLAERFSLRHCSAELSAYRVGISNSLCANNTQTALWPAFLRLEQRALTGTISTELVNSAFSFVAYARIIEARKNLQNHSRLKCIQQLLSVHRGYREKRWWVTWVLVLCCSERMIANFEKNRMKPS